jgi:glutamate synthase domain-containing protein 3
MPTIDLAHTSLRELNATLHRLKFDSNETHWRVLNPRGQHAVAVGIDGPILVEIEGHVGYYCAGMNQCATVVVHGNAGPGVAENMMSGQVHVKGDVSQAAGATGRGGLLVVDGNAAARCGISMKGIDIVVKGSVGPLSAFMAQAGCLYVGGTVKSLGADCVHKPLQDHHRAELARLLEAGGVKGEVDINRFRRYGSARRLYQFHIDNVGSY